MLIRSLALILSGALLLAACDEDPYRMNGFSFVRDYLAGMPRPGSWAPLEQDLDYLSSRDISVLVSLTESAPDAAALQAHGIELLHLPVEDFHAPSQAQLAAFVERTRLAVAAGDKVGVHCAAGMGRTGTFLAAWSVAQGSSATDAVSEIRAARPGSIETAAQVEALEQFGAAQSR